MNKQLCPHCGSAFEQAEEGCCPVCHQALALPPSDKDLWFPNHQTESLFQHACAELLATPSEAPMPRSHRSRWLLVSTLIFVLVLLAQHSAAKVGILVGVLLFHELGHYLGMRLCGYKDVSIFFIPLFGAATVGRKDAAPEWQQVVVLLLGPLPGLILGSLLWVGLVKAQHPFVCEAAGWLIALNLLNMAPLEPLDGGRLINLLLFYRRPEWEAAALCVSAVTLALVGELVFDSWILLGLAVLILLSVPDRYATARAACRLHQQWPNLPPQPGAMSQTQLRDTFRQLMRSLPKPDLQRVVRHMKQVHERAAAVPLSPLAKGFFLALIALAVGFTFYSGAYEALPRLVLAHPTVTQPDAPSVEQGGAQQSSP
jgi:Zn-dependent protease